MATSKPGAVLVTQKRADRVQRRIESHGRRGADALLGVTDFLALKRARFNLDGMDDYVQALSQSL